jgi:hypothetical protein
MKKNNIEDNNISITTTRESKIIDDEYKNFRMFDQNKNTPNVKLKSQGKIKAVIPSGNNLRYEINNKITKKMNEKIIEDQINTNFTLSKKYNNDNYNNRTRKFRYTQSDLLDAEKELNVSNIMQIQPDITDDLLLYNKEDQLLNSTFNKHNINIEESYTDEIHSFNLKNFSRNLESEEILDDKWDDIRKYLNLRDIAFLSITNKKIGKNAISEIIQELEKEKNYYEEKILSSVILKLIYYT